MISYSIYKVMHLTGILMVFLSLGGLVMHAINKGTNDHLWRKPVAITHGLGLLLSLVGGFGLLARLGVMHGTLPGWVLTKLGIWLIFALLIGVLIRRPAFAKTTWVLTILLGGLAAYLAGSKPF